MQKTLEQKLISIEFNNGRIERFSPEEDLLPEKYDWIWLPKDSGQEVAQFKTLNEALDRANQS